MNGDSWMLRPNRPLSAKLTAPTALPFDADWLKPNSALRLANDTATSSSAVAGAEGEQPNHLLRTQSVGDLGEIWRRMSEENWNRVGGSVDDSQRSDDSLVQLALKLAKLDVLDASKEAEKLLNKNAKHQRTALRKATSCLNVNSRQYHNLAELEFDESALIAEAERKRALARNRVKQLVNRNLADVQFTNR